MKEKVDVNRAVVNVKASHFDRTAVNRNCPIRTSFAQEVPNEYIKLEKLESILGFLSW
jgi:hypothetical protein